MFDTITASTANIVNRFMQSPEAKALVDQQKRDALDERKTAVATIAAAEQEHARASQAHARKIGPAQKRHEAAKVEEERLRAERLDLESAQRRELAAIQARIDRARADLERSAPPLLKELRARAQALLVNTYDQRRARMGRSFDGREIELASTQPSIARRAEQIQHLMNTAIPSLRYEALTDDEILVRFDEFCAALPAIEMVELYDASGSPLSRRR